MKSKQFLQEIRKIGGLPRAVLKRIEVTGKEIVFHLVTDATYSKEDVAAASAVCSRYVPAGFVGAARVVKSVPDEEGIRRAVRDILAARFPSLAAFIQPTDIEVIIDEGGGRFFLTADEGMCAQLHQSGVSDVLTKELQRGYPGTWYGQIRYSSHEKGDFERDAAPPEELVFLPRYFSVEGYDAIDGGEGKKAIYIADLNKEMENVTVCGAITYIEERTTKKGKPFFSLTLSDTTGAMRATYYTKKATVEKVRALSRGDSVVLTGDNELWEGKLSFRAKTIDLGAPPHGFVPEMRPSRPVPKQYRAVFPSPASDMVQGDLFGGRTLPEALVKGEFVVYDLETTGLNSNPASGMDRIIEIGAVKISDGKICEKFSSFVACPTRLPEVIVELTGINDEMLKGAPDIKDVIADFFRFSAGCTLVGFNSEGFDSKFIRYYGEKEGYLFDHKQYDVLLLAQRLLPQLGSHKLNIVADHFGFSFNHHRAYDDAFVTGKIFIELAVMMGDLP